MVRVKHLNKYYGDFQALKDININLEPGKITGIIGKNGAGKSTLFHALLNFVKYDGEIEWSDGGKINYENVGYLPEERSLIQNIKVYDQIAYIATLKGINRHELKTMIPEWMDKLKIKGKPSDKVKKLSKGNQQKIQFIMTLMHSPKYIILDEPFSGLDPLNVSLMQDIILEEKRRGATIIFSDHNMNNVSKLCDDLIMVNSGEVVLDGSIKDVRNSFGATNVFLEGDFDKSELEALPGVTAVSQNEESYKLVLEDESYGQAVFDAVTHGKYIKRFSQEPPTLEEIFRMKAEG
ncbi:MAG: ATP-binding cassette domain-containing protein [Limosilactobacillus sp.]|uniref:ABC transporter ATP-binding protein n=1 Tax=Limosilactobacillus sp. TaxID=2773925 RepID=UPI0026F7DB2A|nr:ATP-binding cassette domain-containing protein [Limosilactobacillus sp.]